MSESKIKRAVEWIAIISILLLTVILTADFMGEGLPCISQECLRLDRIHAELVRLNEVARDRRE